MRSFTLARRAAAAAVAFAVTLAATAAGAGELLVMPYACQMSGGTPVLTPSADQGYKIIGEREARDFTACSPANPEMCRRWKLHRFDIDCGGKRVPWVSVSAAADAHSSRGRSWVENGRMHLEMPPRWGMSADDPCARRPRFGWRAANLNRHCADRPRASVEMPAGFAPVLDMDAIFVADNAPGASVVPTPGRVAAEAVPPVPKPRNETPRAAEKPVKAPATPQPAGESKPAIKPAQPTPASKPPAPPPPRQEPTETAAAPGSPMVPVIINAPGAGQANPAAAKEQPETTPIAAPETTSALADATDTLASSKTTEVDEGAPVPAEQGERAIAVTLVERLTQSMSPALLGVGGVTFLGLLALLFAARRSEAEHEYPLARDFGAVSLDGRPGGRELARRGRWLAKAAPRGVPSAPAARGGAVATWGSNIPETREQALQVLGMGVSAGVGDAAIKKIIDGLRMSWHPDHATNAADRELRELRIKQINAAWDIITGKREG